jgi:hypothetical protein
MSATNSILTSAGTRQNTVLRDYRHAARLFIDGQFRLSPKYGFLFYVQFDFNPDITSISNTAAQELGMIVKSVTLPKFTIDTKIHNAYNRVNIVQNKIKYDPVLINFHDDQADNVRNFWYDYYSFFFRDPDYADVTYTSPHKYNSRPSFDWGYSPRPTAGFPTSNRWQPYQYIQSIRIYSMYQKNFSEYQLINPVITAFRHGEHQNGESSLMGHEMTVQFETVKYLTGYVTRNNVGGFVDLHYDNTPSTIAPTQGTNIIPNGQGGFTQAPDTITDLASTTPIFQNELLGGTFTRSTYTAQTFGSSFNISTLSSTFGIGNSLGINSGGFSIPSLGRSAPGLTNSSVLQQQLTSGAANIVGGVVNNAANGLIGGLAKGLGPNGGSILGLTVQAIANPKALAATAVNMAATAAVQYVGQAVNELTKPLIDEASGAITGFVKENFTTPLTAAWGDLSSNVTDFFAPSWTDVGGFNILDIEIVPPIDIIDDLIPF